MARSRRKILQHINAYSSGDKFYLVGLVQQPNLTWVGINPVKEVAREDVRELAQAIDVIRSSSTPFSRQNPSPQQAEVIDEDSGKIFDTADRIWSIRWYDDGSVLIVPQERLPPSDDPELAGGVGWRSIQGAEQLLAPPVSTLSVAQILQS